MRVRILVFGAGAIGSLLGGLLSRENEVTIVGRKHHVDAINRKGLHISGATTFLAWPTAVTAVPTGDYDAIFVATKAYDTATAVDALRAFWREGPFITLQNGLGNAEALAAKAARVVAGTTTHGVTFVAPGEIIHAGAGETVVGPWDRTTRADAERIAGVLTAAGMRTSVTDDVRRELWAKAVVNAAINPLTAVLRRPNGDLAAHPDLRALLDRIAREGVLAANAAGASLDADGIAAKAVEVAAATAGNRSSMLQDVERGRRTEIEAIAGCLIEAIGAKGPPIPYIRTMYAVVRGLERGAESPS